MNRNDQTIQERHGSFASLAIFLSLPIHSLGCATIKQQAHEAHKRLTGIECRPTGGVLEPNRQMIAPGEGKYVLMCANGMMMRSETLETKWLGKEELAAAEDEIRQQKKREADAEQAEAEATTRRWATEQAAAQAAMPQPPAGRVLCPSPLVAYLTYHEGCTRPGMEAFPIKDGCVALMDGRLITRQKVPDGYLISGNYELLGGDGANCPLAFDVAMLETPMELSRGNSPMGYAEYAGTISYTALDGFTKNVLKFRAIPSAK